MQKLPVTSIPEPHWQQNHPSLYHTCLQYYFQVSSPFQPWLPAKKDNDCHWQPRLSNPHRRHDTVGFTLASWDDLRVLIEDHAVKRKISFFCKPKDGMRANYICRRRRDVLFEYMRYSMIWMVKSKFEKLIVSICVGASSSDSHSAQTTFCRWLSRMRLFLLAKRRLSLNYCLLPTCWH